MGEEKLIEQFNIIDTIKYDLTEDNVEFEDKICQFIEKDYDVSSIVSSIKDFNLINRIINKINSIIYFKNKYDIFYRNNISKMSDEQKADFVLQLSQAINIDTYIEGRLTSLLNMLGNNTNIDNIINKFTTDELLKDGNSANEIINIINNKYDISLSTIDYYVSRIIGLILINDELIEKLWKLKKKINLENLKLLSATISKDYIDRLDNDKTKYLFDIYKSILIDDDNKEYIETTMNDFLNTKLYVKVLEYMVLSGLMIKDTYNFIKSKIDFIKELNKINGLNKILIIDDDFINNVIADIKNTEYSAEKILYISSLSEKIKESLIDCEKNYDNDDYIFLINVQKIIKNQESEIILANWQKNIVENGSDELLINILERLIKLNNSNNKKIVKIGLENRIAKSYPNDLLIEKINAFCSNNNYRKIKFEEKKLVNS